MEKREKISERGIQCSLCILMGFALTCSVISYFKWMPETWYILGMVMVVNGLLIVLTWNKWTSLIGVGSSMLGIVLYSIMRYIEGDGGTWFHDLQQEIRGFLQWVQAYIQGNQVQQETYKQYLVLILLIVCVLWVYIWTVKKFNISIVIGTTGILYGIQYIKKIPTDTWGFNAFVLAALAYYFYGYYKKLKHGREGGKDISGRRYLCITGGIVLSVCGVSMIGASYRPIEWGFLHSILDEKIITSTPYYFPYSGSLGGNIELNDTLVLEVDAQIPTYLSSQYKTTYTGKGWKNEDESMKPQGNINSMDTYETFWNLEKRLNLNEELLFDTNELRITYRNIYTPLLFLPNKIDSVQFEEGVPELYLKPYERVVMNTMETKDFTYEVKAYEPRYTSMHLDDVLQSSKRGIYYALRQEGIAPGTTTILEERADRIYREYTALPSTMPWRIRTLAEEITGKWQTDYEKVKAIEEYLTSHYTYTLKPGNVPQDKDFVAYFLFDKQEGYCTYFASAMAVLVRSIGLPSRYVEGYVMNQSQDTETGTYLITNKQAHAWVEVYFEGFGWMAFEPTAPYREGIRDEEIRELVTDEEDRHEEIIINEIPKQSFDWQEVIAVIMKLVLNGIFIGIGCSGVIYGIYKWMQSRKRSKREQVIILYEKLLKKLAKKGRPFSRGSLFTNYAKEIQDEWHIEEMQDVTHLFLQAMYSEEPIDDQQFLKYREQYRACIMQIKKSKRHKNVKVN